MRNSLKRWLQLRREPYRAQFYEAHRRWRMEGGEQRREEFDFLDPDSIVFDFGGFEGGWTDAIHVRYRCNIQIFEPHPRFAEKLTAKYRRNSKIAVHPYALGKDDGSFMITDEGDASSNIPASGNVLEAKSVSVKTFFEKNPVKKIDLAKINIEGGEYDLIPALISDEFIGRFDRFQIQFHLFQKQDIKRREEIVEELSRTHHRDWCYDFVWEQWSVKK